MGSFKFTGSILSRVRNVLIAVLSFLTVFYLALGAYVYIQPRMHCPALNVNSKPVPHSGGLIHDVIAWVTWPGYVVTMQEKAHSEGKSLEDVLIQDVCP